MVDPKPVTEWNGRYLILFFDCLLCCGIYFCFDMPSALQSDIQNEQESNCTSLGDKNNSSNSTVVCCTDCLGLGPDKYNQLYAAFSWTNAIFILPGSIFVDKVGVRISGILFTSIALVGTILITIATLPHFRATSFLFPMLVAGRILLAIGSGPVRTVQVRVIAMWFPDKLAVTYGLAVTFLRLGSVLNFLVTPNIAVKYGLTVALWGGVFMCGTVFVSSIFLTIMDWYGSTRTFRSETKGSTKSSQSSLTCKDIRTLTAPYWFVAFTLASFYTFLNPFIANFPKYAMDKYGYSKTKAAYIDGAIYDVAVFLCPIVGHFTDKFGWRTLVSVMGILLSIPMLLLVMFTDVHPLIATIGLGIGYTITVISLWPCIALLVPIRVVGTANGMVISMLHICLAFTNFSVGKILGDVVEKDIPKRDEKWRYSWILLLCIVSCSLMFGIALNILDIRMGFKLNRPKSENMKETKLVDPTDGGEDDEQKPLLSKPSPKIQ